MNIKRRLKIFSDCPPLQALISPKFFANSLSPALISPKFIPTHQNNQFESITTFHYHCIIIVSIEGKRRGKIQKTFHSL